MDPETLMDILQGSVPRVKIPGPGDRVYKDECVYSFDNPESETGLYVCLNTFWGLGREYVDAYARRTANRVFLHIHRIKHKVEEDKAAEAGLKVTEADYNGLQILQKEKKEKNAEPEKKVTRLAIGVEGGFDAGTNAVEYDIEEVLSLATWPSLIHIPLPNTKIPEQIQASVAAVIAAESALRAAELEAMSGTWDGEIRITSRHTEHLVQLSNGKKIPPKGWKCEVEGCTKTDNLWMNLTDGTILCGRRNFDGSGGMNHAVQHYESTKYPLAVKLGTITPDGKADVFSYDEDDMVLDPKLQGHLAHFGINIATLEKTEKSMAEMEIDLNMRHYGEISALTESGKALKPMRGPGITGMANLGNSCYMNSVMQVLFNIPQFQERFAKNSQKYFETAVDPVNDFNVQMSKLCVGLTSGKYAKKVDEEDNSDAQTGVNPQTFKNLVGKGHVEFSTKKQQDAQEFFLHIINVLERHSVSEYNPAEVFKFKVEDKVQCNETNCVRYAHRTEYCLPLPIPIEAATNKEEVKIYEQKKIEALNQKTTLSAEETVRYKIPFDACLTSFIEKETLDPFYSSAAKSIVTASKFTRLASFPDFLAIQLKKFTMGDDWTPLKLDVAVDMPFEIDLSALKGLGKQPEEIELPDDPLPDKVVSIDKAVVAQLADMGFSLNACNRAIIATENTGTDSAMNWLMGHMDDADLNDPISLTDPPITPTGPDTFVPNEDAMVSIQSMGFQYNQAKKALKATDNNVERAIDWIFSHADDLNSSQDNANNLPSPVTKPYQNVTDGPAKYKLMGFVSHMGPSSMVGHYVAHIWKDNCWVLFNDNRVAASANLPKDLGYLYFYRRA